MTFQCKIEIIKEKHLIKYPGYLNFSSEIDIFEINQNYITPDRRQSKTLILSTNVDQISLETVFDCHLSPDWRQMAIKTLFLAIFLFLFDFKSVFDCRLSGVYMRRDTVKGTP